MKSTTVLSVLATSLLASQGTAIQTTNQQCGDLGIMTVDHLQSSLPADVDLNAIRQCVEHPLSGTSINKERELAARDCWYGAAVGCTKGYCWKTCGSGGSGDWCWTAANGGYGAWLTCSADADCNAAQACGEGGCKACGCSCSHT